MGVALSAVSMVLRGERHPGQKFIKKMIDYFKFNTEQKAYFTALIRIQKKTNNDPRTTLALLREAKLIGSDCRNNPQLYLDWKAHALKESVKLKDFKNNPVWIEKKFHYRIDQESVRLILNQMIEEKILIRHDQKLEINIPKISSQDELNKNELFCAHKCQLKLVEDSFYCPKDQRTLKSTTICIRNKDIPKANELIRRFEEEIEKLSNHDQGDRIYQLNTYFFPLSD
jgi:uncharacterized protein (TIGR02147 family)